MKTVIYKYKDGRFLKTEFLGDGEYELYLVKDMCSNCTFNSVWALLEILGCCDAVYDEHNECIEDVIESDFTQHEVEIKIK